MQERSFPFSNQSSYGVKTEIFATITFVIAEAPAEFLSPLSDKTVTEFETAAFECEVSKPDLKPRWFKGQQEIKDLERFEQTSVGTKHVLTIRECEPQDADAYKIVVEDGVESAAKLTVEGTRITV